MATYAVLENGLVINRLVAESLELAELASGKTCVEYTDLQIVDDGFSYDGTNFIPPQPYASWILNDNFVWVSPVEMPTTAGKNYEWDESSLSWEETVSVVL
jgi:hypothetical protein